MTLVNVVKESTCANPPPPEDPPPPPTGFCLRRQEAVNRDTCLNCFLSHPQLQYAHKRRLACASAHLLAFQADTPDVDIDRIIAEETLAFIKTHDEESILWKLLDRWTELIPTMITVLEVAGEHELLCECFDRYAPEPEPFGEWPEQFIVA